MCSPGQPAAGAIPAPVTGAVPAPATAADAVAMARAALAWLAGADAGALTTAEQADCLRGLEQAESARTAARASVLAAFRASDGYRDDGHGSARTWLAWQTRITSGAASGAMGWMRRLAARPLVRGALAGGQISASWARAICDWTTNLPAGTLLCTFHHLVAVHRWGWEIVLNPDGTVTVTSPDGTQVLHSHSPPTQAA